MQQNEKEKGADQFAAETLIPKETYHDFLKTTVSVNQSSILAYAQEIGIAPGIVVGRLQHDEKIEWNQLNNLKCRLELVENIN